METYLAETIDIISNKEKYDTSVKMVLADKQIIARILKYSLEEFADYEISEKRVTSGWVHHNLEASEVKEISELFEKVQSSLLDFEIYSPKVKPRDKGKKIIPNKTIVWANSTKCPTLYRYNKLAPKPLRGKTGNLFAILISTINPRV